MKNNRVTLSSNFGNPRPKTSNALRGTAASANLSKKERYPPLTQKSKEDDYISSLQKQVYYLELEMKLMKDRELDTKNKIGGYEVLFRDGVPLNENFLALKTKYKNERDSFEKIILDLNTTIDNTNKEYSEAKRLATLLEYFETMPEGDIPNTSLLREFIGGGIFDKH